MNEDADACYLLFYDTVHTVNIKDYTQEQVDVWAPRTPPSTWKTSLANNYTFVAHCADGKIIGFADVEDSGYLNRGFIHKDFQGKGIGRKLLAAREAKAKELGLECTFSDVSITAKGFFEKMGYSVVRKQEVVRAGVVFVNYRMEKKF